MDFILTEFSFRKIYFVNARYSCAVNSPLFSIFTSDLQQTLSNVDTIKKCRSDIYKNKKFCCNKSIIHIKDFIIVAVNRNKAAQTGITALTTPFQIHRGERPKERTKECGKYIYTTTYNT
jgi:hypothetical protein